MSRAFTLIELLIVVAIIGILAAIAVPNFLNAQMRAKISRAMADMRSLSTGVEQLRLDRGVLLIDFWDDDTAKGQERMREDFKGAGGSSQNDRGGTAGLWVPLTTPVSYMASIPVDPFFAPHMGDDVESGLIANDIVPPYAYIYLDEDPKIPGGDGGFSLITVQAGVRQMREGEYVIIGAGPDATRGGFIGLGFPYESSNGLTSSGDIVLRSD